MKVRMLTNLWVELTDFAISETLGVEWNWELEDMGNTTEREEWIKKHCDIEAELIYTNWDKTNIHWKEVYRLWKVNEVEWYNYLILEF